MGTIKKTTKIDDKFQVKPLCTAIIQIINRAKFDKHAYGQALRIMVKKISGGTYKKTNDNFYEFKLKKKKMEEMEMLTDIQVLNSNKKEDVPDGYTLLGETFGGSK